MSGHVPPEARAVRPSGSPHADAAASAILSPARIPGRTVIALGGNALIRRGERGEFAEQRRNVEIAARAIADLTAVTSQIVMTHGNGPQVGFLALEAEAGMPDVPAPPLDVLGAESQGQIGYLISQALRNAFHDRGDAREVAVILTQTVVDAADAAFDAPSKPVGPIYSAEEAHRLAAERGWTVAQDGSHWRRVVPSPHPRRLVEAAVIRRLMQAGALVIASGGGGVPVVEDPDGRLRGVEAVIDKDLAAVIVAEEVRAESLLLLTDVDAVYRDWGEAGAAPIARLTTTEARVMLDAGAFGRGSMEPKVRASIEFVRAGGRWAAIGALERAQDVFEGRSGTRILPAE